ncbi:MAG: hypothetical protein WBY94_28440, partial [Polyangiaceae bacterium]
GSSSGNLDGGSGSSSGAHDGGSGSGGQEAGGQDAGVLCTAPGVPAGCVDCLTNAQCPKATNVCLAGTCVACATSADCAGTSTPVCWPSNHTCHASCAGDGGIACVGPEDHCDTATGACVGCTSNQECAADAGGSGRRPVCDMTTLQCVQCVSTTDCNAGDAGTRLLCDEASHGCVECIADSDCATSAAGPVCRAGVCNPGCTTNTQCPMDGGTPICDTARNACVECLANTDCSGDTPFCRTAGFGGGPIINRCEACLPAVGMDAGVRGCDGGAGSTRCGPPPGMPAAPFVCQ